MQSEVLSGIVMPLVLQLYFRDHTESLDDPYIDP